MFQSKVGATICPVVFFRIEVFFEHGLCPWSLGDYLVKRWFGQSLGFEVLSVRRGRWTLAVLLSRVSAVCAGDLCE